MARPMKVTYPKVILLDFQSYYSANHLSYPFASSFLVLLLNEV